LSSGERAPRLRFLLEARIDQHHATNIAAVIPLDV